MKVKSKSEATPSNPMDRSPPSSSIHGIFQARVLEWGAIAFSDIYIYTHTQDGIDALNMFYLKYVTKNIPGDQTQVSPIAGRFFTILATRETQEY